MGILVNGIDDKVRAFIEAQRMFFVASAPLSAGGHVNLSPKGLDTLRVISPTRVAYLDYVGSGAETLAHLKENGRIVIMFCAMQGPPKILRLHGRGVVLEPQDETYQRLRPMFAVAPAGRAIVVVDVDRVADSCGFGVPLYQFDRDRTQLVEWSERKGAEGLRDYQIKKNAVSLDGLPALDWVQAEAAAKTGE